MVIVLSAGCTGEAVKRTPLVRNENKIYMIGQTFTGFSFRNYENKDPLFIVSLGNLP